MSYVSVTLKVHDAYMAFHLLILLDNKNPLMVCDQQMSPSTHPELVLQSCLCCDAPSVM